MKKLRSDSSFNGLTAGQREQLLGWLFNENMGYAAAVERVKKEFGIATTKTSMGRFYRHAAEERHVGDLALAQGSVADFRTATRKLLGAATLQACMHNHDPREDGWKAVSALTKLMLQDERRELQEKWLELELQRLGLKK